MLDHFSSGKATFIPGELQLQFWEEAIKHDEGYGKAAWKTLNVSHTLKRWTSSPAASSFTAPEPDPGLSPLECAEMMEHENELVSFQQMAGGVGAVATRVLALFDEKGKELGKAVSRFRDPATPMENPREEAAKLLEGMKATLHVDWAKDLTDLVKIDAALYNKIIQIRRYNPLNNCFCLHLLSSGLST